MSHLSAIFCRRSFLIGILGTNISRFSRILNEWWGKSLD
jgi:hypothetical protein